MKITHHLFDSSTTDMVAFSRNGDAYTDLRRGGMCVGLNIREYGETQFNTLRHIRASGDYGFSRVGTRSYLRGIDVDGRSETVRETEALFVNIGNQTLDRFSTRGREQSMRLTLDASAASCVTTSQDGRHIGIGGVDGQFELWNMDMEPHRYLQSQLGDYANISDICFGRSNLDVLVATIHGDLAHWDTAKEEVYSLNSENRLPIYSIDGQPEGRGFVFGGEGEVLWFVRTAGAGMDSSVDIEESPFALNASGKLLGNSNPIVSGFMGASVGSIRTGVGTYVKCVRFLTDELVCVMGPEATEIWGLSGKEPRVVARKAHDPDCRLLGFGGTDEEVQVSLGRPM